MEKIAFHICYTLSLVWWKKKKMEKVATISDVSSTGELNEEEENFKMEKS